MSIAHKVDHRLLQSAKSRERDGGEFPIGPHLHNPILLYIPNNKFMSDVPETQPPPISPRSAHNARY